MPAPDGVIIEEECGGDPRATPALVEENQRVGAPRQAVRARAITRQGDQIGAVFKIKKIPTNHPPSRIQIPDFGKPLQPDFD